MIRPLLGVALALIVADVAWADGEAQGDGQRRSRAGFRDEVGLGPTSVEAALVEGDRVTKPLFTLRAFDRALQPYFRWKGRINRRHGLMFGADYQALYQRVDQSPGEDEAAGGIFRVYGEWALLNRCRPCHQGSLVFKVEHRHTLGTTVAPQDLGAQFGYGGATGSLFSDLGLALTNFFWKQRFGSRNQGVVIFGQIDPLDYVDVAGIGNPFTAWQNLSVLVNPTIPIPNQGLAAAASWMFDSHWYAVAGFSDANALPTRDFTQTWQGFETFKHAEFGWTGGREHFFRQNVHLTVWHQDDREDAGTPEAWGWAVSGSSPLGGGWSAAVRAGWSSAAVGFAERHAGFLLERSFNREADAIGLGVGWDDVWGAVREDQLSAELFLRAQLAQSFAVTPSLQYIRNPAFNANDDEAWVFSIRVRLVL